MYYLVLASSHDPSQRSSSSVGVVDRALEHVRNLISGGNEPGCSGGPDAESTSFAIRSLAAAREVPKIWHALSAAERDSIALLMKACLVGAHFVHDDDRETTTGIDQLGGADKRGNPSAVEGGVGTALAAAYHLGPKAAEAFLAGFDAAAFLAELDAAGFTNTAWVFRRTPAAELEAATRDEFTYHGHRLTQPFRWVERRADVTYSQPVAPWGAAGRGHLTSGAKSLPNTCELGMSVEFDGTDANGILSDLERAALGWANSLANLWLVDHFGDVPEGAAAAGTLRRHTVGTTDLVYKAAHGYRGWSFGADWGDRDAKTLDALMGYRWLEDAAKTAPSVSQAGPTAPTCHRNLAFDAVVEVSSTLRDDTGGANVTDGLFSDPSRWVSAEGDATPTITLDLGSPADIAGFEIHSGYNWPYVPADGVLVDFVVEAHTETGWQEIARFTDNAAVRAATSGLNVRADQVRLVITDPSRHATDVARVSEFVVYG